MGYNNVDVMVSGPNKPSSTYKTKILKGNHDFTSQVTDTNTKYVIKYDFDLDDETVTVPKNCILEFDGGSLNNGTVICANTSIVGNKEGDVVFSGSWIDKRFDTLREDTDNLQEGVNQLKEDLGPNGSVNQKIEATKDEIIDNASEEYNTLKKLEDKILAEQQRASEAENNRYTKSETYNKTQLDNMITTPEINYFDYDTYADMLAETEHPAGAIYRVANYDGTQAVTNKYAEYSWDGTQYKLMAVRDYGIDDEPTAGSDRLVKSGGVENFISPKIYRRKALDSDGVTVIGNGKRAITSLIKGLFSYTLQDGITLQYIYYYDIFGNFIGRYEPTQQPSYTNIEKKNLYRRFQFSKVEDFSLTDVIFTSFSYLEKIYPEELDASIKTDLVVNTSDALITSKSVSKYLLPLAILYRYYINSTTGEEIADSRRCVTGFIRGKYNISINTGYVIKHTAVYKLDGTFVGLDVDVQETHYTRIIFGKSDDSDFVGGENVATISVYEDIVNAKIVEIEAELQRVKQASEILYNNDNSLIGETDVQSCIDKTSGVLYGINAPNVNYINNKILYELGSISTSTGENEYDGNTTRLRTVGKFDGSSLVSIQISSSAPSDFMIYRVYLYNKTTGAFVRHYDVNGTSYNNISNVNGYDLRILCKGATLTKAAGQWVTITQLAGDCSPLSTISINNNPVFEIENDCVKGYIDNVHYYEKDFTVSYVNRYVASVRYRKDRPKINTLDLPYVTSTGGTVEIYTDPTYTELFNTVNINLQKQVHITNLIPNRIYYYIVRDSESNIIGKGIFSIKGCVRMLSISSLLNVRDIGGIKTTNGRTLRYGRFYRGSRLDSVTQADINTCRNILGVTAHLNMENPEETSLVTSPLGNDVAYYNVEGHSFIDWDSADAITNIVLIIKKCAEWLNSGLNIYAHCWGGADRTGYLAFLLEAICGVPQVELNKDYELTSFSSYGLREITDSTTWKYPTAVNAMYNLTGDTFQDKIIGFLVNNGVTQTEISQIQKELII